MAASLEPTAHQAGFARAGRAISLTLSRPLVASLLLATWAMCFLLPPYWKLLSGTGPQLAALGITLAAGLLWAGWSSGPVRLRLTLEGVGLFGGLLALVAILSAAPLTAPLHWGGDEDHHWYTTNFLLGHLPEAALLVGAILGPLLVCRGLGWSGRSGRARLLVLAAQGALITGVVLWHGNLAWPSVARYPLFVNWLSLGPAVVPAILRMEPVEASFRIVPLVSTALTLFICARRLRSPGWALPMVYGVALATIPVLYYFTSILYLEMPALFLMTAVCLYADPLLRLPGPDLRRHPVWYAAILIGFVKETTIAFLVVLVGCRLLAQLYRNAGGGRRGRLLAGELAGAAAVLLPCTLYLVYRVGFSDVGRGFHPELGLLVQPEAYLELGRAFLKRLPLLALLFPLGLLLAWRTESRTTALFWLGGFVGYGVFHMLDGMRYLGFPRFMLLFLPPMLAALTVLVRRGVQAGGRSLVAFALLAMVALQVTMAPIHPDGARRPSWGDSSYPYQAAITYVLDHYGKERVLFGGMPYPYRHFFYVRPADKPAGNWLDTRRPGRFTLHSGPRHEAGLRPLLKRAVRRGYPLVLYHPSGPDDPRPATMAGYRMVRVFSNSVNNLVLYQRDPSEPIPTGWKRR